MGRTIVHDYTPYGAVRELWETYDDEVLLEGPAGTGKTRGLLEWIFAMCEMHPGIRVLFLRDTRVSMSETVLVTWEQQVVPPGHPILMQGGTRGNRDNYQWPDSKDGSPGAEIVLAGIDRPDKFMSGFFDIIILFEGIEVSTVKPYEQLLTRLRNMVLPGPGRRRRQQMIVDTNPGSPHHWLNRRFKETGVRLYSRHQDNPIYWDREKGEWTDKGEQYMGILEKLTGARRANYLYGQWMGEEGMCFEFYDPAVHDIYHPKPNDQGVIDYRAELGITDWFGSMDFGYTAPGCFQLWGVKTGTDGLKVAYRTKVIYHTKRLIDWWAGHIEDLWSQGFKMRRIFADAEDPGSIEFLNQRLGPLVGRNAPKLVVPIDKGPGSVRAGIDQVNWALGNQQGVANLVPTKTRMFFLKDAQYGGIDPELAAEMLPVNDVQEFQSYVWDEQEPDKPIRERPKEGRPNHGCDTTRYFSVGSWPFNLGGPVVKDKPKRGTVDDVLGWDRPGDDDDAPRKWRPGAGWK